jgi:hypothetical protein
VLPRFPNSLCSPWSSVSSSPSPHRRAHLPQPGLKGLETARLGNCVTPTAPHNHLSARTACACISTQAQLNHTQVVLERQGAKWLPCQGLAVAGAVSLHNRNHRILLTWSISQVAVALLLHTLPKSDYRWALPSQGTSLCIHLLEPRFSRRPGRFLPLSASK